MKTLRTLIAMAMVLTVSGILTQCKKSNDNKTSCQIITATPVPGTPLHLTYNSEGKLSRVVSGISVFTYDYSAGSTIILESESDNFTSKTTATLNSDGLATNVRTENDTTGAIWSNTFYEYNGQELTRSTFTSSAGGRPIISTFTWANQNLATLTTDTTTEIFGYYTDKPVQTGDYFLLVDDLQGYTLYRNKNLLKSVASSVLIYQFGTDGKINSFSATTGTNESFIYYEYQCD